MPRCLYIILITLLFINTDILSQDRVVDYSNYNQSLGLQVYFGITSFDLEEAKNFFLYNISRFNDENIPLEEQKTYPPGALLGGNIYFFPSSDLSLSIGIEFTKTKAYSLYGDYSGKIDLKSTIELQTFYAGFRKYFMSVDLIQPFVGLNAGYMRGYYNIEWDLEISLEPPIAFHSFSSYDNSGYSIEGFVGAAYNITYIVLELQFGYRFSEVPRPEREDISGDYFYERIFDLQTSGFSLKLSARAGLYW